ncbi:MAG: tetraacyldisaccharide 4'-kinase [Candidatus Omnitrophica bacterium]|jgi:tetraacyldisaccharide 4'-kinase|nr:tetraacyldisaccharide 4'-kinase [Candidatus Omnitrophota bacterium]
MFSPRDYLYNLVTGKIKGPLAVFFKWLLFVLSLVYGLVVLILAGFYRLHQAHVNCKVISVGNITLGGTGKTSLVEFLVAKLSQKGNRIAVLTRGYKRDARLAGVKGMGDEPAMLQKKLPQAHVVVDKDRLRGAARAIKEHAVDTLVLDDGMQQWRIFKDLEIVTIDTQNPFGNLRLLPAGFLREPLRALSRADVFVLTQSYPGQDTSDIEASLKRFNSRALIVESRHRPEGFSNLGKPCGILSTDTFQGKSVLVFSAIGNPLAFENTVCSLGINIAETLRFADHHDYAQADLDDIFRRAKERRIDTIITTEKDAVKVSRFKIDQADIFSLNIKLSITKNEAEFDRRLFKLYSL